MVECWIHPSSVMSNESVLQVPTLYLTIVSQLLNDCVLHVLHVLYILHIYVCV